jgi:hypothetical protein
MDKYTATEQAFKNGYEKGYEAGKRDAVKWIPVSDPPKEKGCYLTAVKHWFDGKPVTREAFWNSVDWLTCEEKYEITPRVTHWMPLPEPPKEGER